MLDLIDKYTVKGIAHITGGGFIENIPRILPEGLAAEIDRSSYELPPIFKALKKRAGISDVKMYNTFNMGIGMVLAVSPDIAGEVLSYLESKGENAVRLGVVVKGEGVIL